MYENFFGLTAKPFSLVPDPRFLFLSKTHKKALCHLDYGLREGAGFILLTGEVGSGKTTIVKDLIRRLDQSTILAMIFNTSINGDQLLAAVNEEFGLEVAGRDKMALQRELNDFLIAQYAAGIRPILIIDEAQNLPPESLEQVRMLSNLEARDTKLLQIVLIGQPELQETLDQHCLRQLRQRIGISCHLSVLTAEEVGEYIGYRLEKAGNRQAVNFAEGSFEVIHHYSGGIPRLINRICDYLLLVASGEETRDLSLDLVTEVAIEVGDRTAMAGSNGDKSPQSPEIEARLDRMEEDIIRYLSGALEKERIFERLTLFENVLKRIHKKQRLQGELLEEFSARLEQLEKQRGISLVK